LEYAKRGGRIGSTTAAIGGLLGLRPILQVEDGLVTQLDNVRGKKKVIRLLGDAAVSALKGEEENIKLSIGHIFSQSEAGQFKENLEGSLGIEIGNPVTQLGPVIGAHAGPGALAIAYCKKYEAVEGD
jgi:DegV family protein with EDD domain